MSGENTIVLVFVLDNNYIMPAAVTLKSALDSTKKNRLFQIFIIDGGVRKSNKKRFLDSFDQKYVSITWLKPHKELSKILKKLPVRAHFTRTGYYKLFIPNLLPKNTHKAIYLDPDLIVFGNIDELWSMNFGDSCLLAANSEERKFKVSEKILPEFNTGVMVLDCKKWRSENLQNQILDFIKVYRNKIYNIDQDVLNSVLTGGWKSIDPIWNVAEGRKGELENPKIIHFVGGAKPWNVAGEKRSYSNYFYHFLDMTAWKGWRLTFFRKVQQKLCWKCKYLRKVMKK